MQRINLVPCFSILATPLLLAVIIGMSGCIAIPYPDHRVLEGAEITEESLAWLHVDETTRSQVLEELGPPDIDFVDQRVIAYAWSGTSSAVSIAFWGGGASSSMLSGMRRALLVQFDSGNRVTAFSIIDRPAKVLPYDALDQSSDAHLDDWRVLLGDWLASQSSATKQRGAATHRQGEQSK